MTQEDLHKDTRLEKIIDDLEIWSVAYRQWSYVHEAEMSDQQRDIADTRYSDAIEALKLLRKCASNTSFHQP